MATKQGFYSRVHLYDDLTFLFSISIFRLHFLIAGTWDIVKRYLLI